MNLLKSLASGIATVLTVAVFATPASASLQGIDSLSFSTQSTPVVSLRATTAGNPELTSPPAGGSSVQLSFTLGAGEDFADYDTWWWQGASPGCGFGGNAGAFGSKTQIPADGIVTVPSSGFTAGNAIFLKVYKTGDYVLEAQSRAWIPGEASFCSSPGATSPAWDTNLANGGVPSLQITDTIATVSSNPGPLRSGGLTQGFARIYACNQPVTAGFYSWSAPVGQPIFPPTNAIGGATCFEIGTGTTGLTLDLNSVGTLANGMTPYNPQTHGVNITVGWRDADNFGTPSPTNQDDLMWLSLGNSVVYSPPSAPPATTPAGRTSPILSLSSSTVVIDQQMVWELRSDWARNVLFVCTDEAIALVLAESDYFVQCEIVSIADFGAPLTSFSTVSGTLLSGASYSAADHGSKFVYVSIYWANDNINSNPVYFGVSNVLDASTASAPETEDVVRPEPFAGPVLQTPGALQPVVAGAKVVIPGTNLSGISKVTIDGKDATISVNSFGDLELTIPEGLAPGSYDLVITSNSGVLTVQSAIVISGAAVVSESAAQTSTKRKEDNTVKVWVFDVVGSGKVQIMLNGKEVAWVNAVDRSDSKLFNGYFVRTLTLSEGKNVIEVFVGGKRVDRKAYSG